MTSSLSVFFWQVLAMVTLISSPLMAISTHSMASGSMFSWGSTMGKYCPCQQAIIGLNLTWMRFQPNYVWDDTCNSIFSCDQAALWMVQSVCLSVCPSVRPSVCHTFLTMFPSSYHYEIFRSYYQWQKWRPCKRSRSEVKGQGHRGHNLT